MVKNLTDEVGGHMHPYSILKNFLKQKKYAPAKKAGCGGDQGKVMETN